MRTCGATPGGPSLDGIDLSKQTVIQGVILRDGQSTHEDAVGVPNGTPVERAHVRLLDSDGEFTAEVPTNGHGQFRFFAAPGAWTVRALVPGAIGEAKADADYGRAVDLTISL